jgi:hypothetical protein
MADHWLIDEIHQAARETTSWPAWMKDNRLWHKDLAARSLHSGRFAALAAGEEGASKPKARKSRASKV